MSKNSKPNILSTLALLLLAAAGYFLIFSNIDQLNAFYLSKHVVPALCLLATIVTMAFLYGTGVSQVLSLLGLESDH